MEIELVDIDGNPLPAGHGCSASIEILDSEDGSDWMYSSWHYDWYELSATTGEASNWEFMGFKWIQNRYGRVTEHGTDRSSSYRIEGRTYYYPASGKNNTLRSGEEQLRPEYGGGTDYIYIYGVQAVFKKTLCSITVYTLERPHLDAGTASPDSTYQGGKGDKISITFSAIPNEKDGWTFYRWKKDPNDPINIIPRDKIKKRTFTIELEITQEYEQHFVYAIFNKRGILRDKRSNIVLCNSTKTEILRMD